MENEKNKYDMNALKNSFGLFFYLARKWEHHINKILKDDQITLKQLLVLIVIKTQFKTPPGVMEVAKNMDTSHQNIMAISKILEKKGLVSLIRNPADNRMLRIHIPPESKSLWEKRAGKDQLAMTELFSCLTPEELKKFSNTLIKLTKHFEKIKKD